MKAKEPLHVSLQATQARQGKVPVCSSHLGVGMAFPVRAEVPAR